VSQSSFIFLVPPIRRRPLKKDKTLWMKGHSLRLQTCLRAHQVSYQV
jgi:hypothetical protein